MGLLTNLFENETIKKAAFGQLRNIIVDENLEAIIVTVDKVSGDLSIKMYKAGEIIITPVNLLENGGTENTK